MEKENMRIEVKKRRMLENEENVRLYNQHRHQALEGYLAPNPPLYVYGRGVGQMTSPFLEEIRRAVLPQNFKIPNLERYLGRTNPAEHLGAYRV